MSTYSFNPSAMIFMPIPSQNISFNPSALPFTPASNEANMLNSSAAVFTPIAGEKIRFSPAVTPFLPATTQQTSPMNVQASIFVPVSQRRVSASVPVATKSMPVASTSPTSSTKSLLSIAEEMDYLVHAGVAEPWDAGFFLCANSTHSSSLNDTSKHFKILSKQKSCQSQLFLCHLPKVSNFLKQRLRRLLV